MLKIKVENEVSRLRTVVLGISESNGPIPKAEACYDLKSRENVLAGTYPKDEDMILELDALAEVFKKYNIQVLRPDLIENCNQLFSRDIAFVIDDKIIKANIIDDRNKEVEAITYIWNQIEEDKRIILSPECKIEGGDVSPYNDYVFIGTYSGEDFSDYITARTNMDAVIAIQELFPDKIVKPLELKKSNTDGRKNILHLDCCFQPIGKGKVIISKSAFIFEKEYEWLVDFFGKENVFEITEEEAYQMYSNVVSISEDVIVSDKRFIRLNEWLTEENFIVEEVSYKEISKQGGLLHCTTMPLIRD